LRGDERPSYIFRMENNTSNAAPARSEGGMYISISKLFEIVSL